MEKLKVLDLFSGIGGFSLGLERTGGFETVAFCEIEEFPRKVLNKHWPNIPIYEDVRELTNNNLKEDGIKSDIVVGGFPCQPFSTAAAGNNPEDYLSQEFGRIIWETKPKYLIAENTEKKAFSKEFIGRLRALNYEIYPVHISADDVGADHERGRWWLCAYPHNKSELPAAIDAETSMLQKVQNSVWGAENYARAIRVPDGLPDRIHRLKSLGNAVVPQIPELIGRAILEVETGKEV